MERWRAFSFARKIKHKLVNQSTRTKQSLRNSFYMFFIRMMSMGISFLYVPILIHQLNNVNYGIWLTLTSIVSWCSFLDIGLGHGLRNLLAEAIAKNERDRMKSLVGTSYIILSIISLLFIPIVCIVFPFFNWAKILNAPPSMEVELLLLSIVVIICFFLQFTLRLINSILFAVQKPALSSFISFIAQFIAFIVVFILSLQDKSYSLLIYGSIISIIPIVVMLLYTFILFKTQLNFLSFTLKDIKFSLAPQLFNLGLKFFSIQLTAILLFQTNNLILAHVAGPDKVTDFNLSYKYIGIVSMIFTIIVTPMWSATTDAYHRQDFDWIKKTIRVLRKVFLLMSIGGIVLVTMSGWVYSIWVKDAVQVDYGIQILVLLYFLCSMWCGIHCNIINGIGKVKLQFVMTTVEAFVHIPLAIFLGRLYGVYGVLTSMFLMTFINTIWEPIQINKILNNKATGIWDS